MGTLSMPQSGDKGRDELAWLESSVLAPGVCVMTDARRFHEQTMAEVLAYCRRKGLRYPAPDHILHSRPRREGGHRG